MRTYQFSAAKLILLVAVAATVCGAFRLVSVYIRDMRREAVVAAQERELYAVGATYKLNKQPPHSISELDLTTATVDQEWLTKRLGYWEYSSIRVIWLRKGQFYNDTVGELRVAFPHIEFVERPPQAQRRR